MNSAAEPKGREASQRRSPLDLIIKQFRRRTSSSDTQTPSGTRLIRPSESGDRTSREIPESGEENDAAGLGTDSSDGSEIGSVVGWGRVAHFVRKLGKTPDSRSLSLSHCDLTATDVLEIGSLLPFLTQLEVLDLSWNDLLGGSLSALSVRMQHVGKLKVLKLSGCRLAAEDLAAVGETLECVPSLEALDLSWNAGVGGRLHLLTQRLHCSGSLRELHLVDCQLSETDSADLAAALLRLPCLEGLDLSCNSLSPSAVENISSSLSSSPQLKTLKMSRCGLNQESLAVLGERMSFLVGLEHLDVSCNKACGGGFGGMAPSLRFLTHLRCLDLRMCCLTEDDVQTLFQVVPALNELSHLDLSCNKSIGTALAFLFPVLPLSKMTTLHLSGCGLSPDAARALASVMPSLLQLQSLNVSWNKSVGGNLQWFVEGLAADCKLEEVKLSSCDLTADDLLHIQAACTRGALSNLQRLDVSYNGRVDDAGWAALFREAGGLKKLQELDVSLRPGACASASAWLSAMTDALPRLPALRRVSMRRWTLGRDERQKLERNLKKRNVVLESDDVNVQNAAG